ncbi:MAG: TIGR00282 family metallophosphoesterase [Oscillospiraceae bacterium]|nr:TIGR00282 family metallophosphoesterase [Oscillospiraceae bacterium]
MNILCIGDICGHIGCEHLRSVLPNFKNQNHIDLVIANGENASEGNGLLPTSAEHIFSSGVDIITSGNHIFRRREIYSMLDENEFVIRPANYPPSANGRGLGYVDLGYTTVAVINILGVVYLEPLACPFNTADALIEEAKSHGAKVIIIDFHAEATSEKRALGFYLDGKISALFGTHTHVPTADAQILPGGTGYITDLGMTGPIQSVLGVSPELAISKLKDKLPVRFKNADSKCSLNGCVFEVDHKTGKTISVCQINI